MYLKNGDQLRMGPCLGCLLLMTVFGVHAQQQQKVPSEMLNLLELRPGVLQAEPESTGVLLNPDERDLAVSHQEAARALSQGSRFTLITLNISLL